MCENKFGAEPNVQMAYSIETFAWDDKGNLLIKTSYPMPPYPRSFSCGTTGDMPSTHAAGEPTASETIAVCTPTFA